MRLNRLLLALVAAALAGCAPLRMSVPTPGPLEEPAFTPAILITPQATAAPGTADLTAAPGSPAVATAPAAGTEAPLVAGDPVSYTIQAGDTLWSLAEKFGVPPELLAAANPTLNPDVLFPGDVVTIPNPAQPLLGVTVEPGEMDARVLPEVDLLRLRAGPSTEAGILAQLVGHTPLRVIGRTADSAWLQVITVLGQTQGWVFAEYVEVFIALDGVPVITPVLVPTVAVSTPAAGTALAPTTPRPPGDYLYLTGLTGRAREIFLQGQALGNRATVFSKVGDSITVSPVFLTAIGLGTYTLHDHAALQPVIDFYSQSTAREGTNSFAYTSLAAKVGWRARAVLSPASADPILCQPNESPLACEYRTVRPAVALIMLGTNDVPYTPEAEFADDMRAVIELSLDRGVIPVISTIPPLYRAGLEGRVELLNGVLVRLAAEYQVPLWDYWAALQSLPGQGMAGDGVHPNWAPAGHSADFSAEYLQYGMTVRNLTALYALDAVWRSAIAP